MSLRNKILITLLAIMAFSLFSYYGIFRTVIIRSFIELDAEHATMDIERCNAALKREIRQLNTFTHDWSSWDDTCRFVSGADKDYITVNLPKQTFIDQKLNLLHIYDKEGRLIWGRYYDLAADKEIPLDLKADLGTELFSRIVSQHNPNTSTSGIISTRYGVMLISSNPILTSENEGPSRGAYVMGRLFTRDMLSMISEQVSIKLDAWPTGTPGLQSELSSVINSFTERDQTKLKEASPEEMHAYSLIRDLRGEPALLIRASIPREIMAKGRLATAYGTGFTIAVGLLTLLIISVMVNSLILKPVAALKDKVTTIRPPYMDINNFETGRQDEIGTLSHEFGDMVQRLSKSEKRYRDIVESIQDIYAEVDLEGNFVFFNESLCRMTDHSHEEIMGKNFRDFVTSDTAQDIYRFFHDIFTTGKPSTLKDFEVMRKDGTTVVLELSVNLMYDEALNPTGFRGTGRDVSERKLAALERERLITELQQALVDIKTLSGLLPICASCKKIRDDKGYWNQIENYISEHSAAVFSHSICPECFKRLYPYLKDK